jgi:hypothetical protein
MLSRTMSLLLRFLAGLGWRKRRRPISIRRSVREASSTLGLTPQRWPIDDSGRILVAGNLSLRRYDAGGNLDPSFGSGGQVSNTIAGAAIIIEASGRIVVGGMPRTAAPTTSRWPASTPTATLT